MMSLIGRSILYENFLDEIQIDVVYLVKDPLFGYEVQIEKLDERHFVAVTPGVENYQIYNTDNLLAMAKNNHSSIARLEILDELTCGKTMTVSVGDPCVCDFHAVLLPYGCQCGSVVRYEEKQKQGNGKIFEANGAKIFVNGKQVGGLQGSDPVILDPGPCNPNDYDPFW
jgi:hypothetical protein